MGKETINQKNSDVSRREFISRSTLLGAAAGVASLGLRSQSIHAAVDSVSSYSHNVKYAQAARGAKSRKDIKLISNTWWDSPQYTAQYPASEKAHKIMKEATVIDSLYCGIYPLQWSDDEQFDLEMKGIMASGINVLGYCTSADVAGSRFMDCINGVEFPLHHINANPHKYMVVRTVDDIKRAKKEGKLGFYFIHQGCEFYEGNPERMAVIRQMGFGYTLLAYNVERSTGDGCAVEIDRGLTKYGKEVVRSLNEYGMIVDVTHVGDRTARDAVGMSATPPIASHSGAWQVNNTYRNISDGLIRAIAQRGGVIAPVSCALWADPENPPAARPEIMFKHIDYIAQMLGNVDHIGYGSDYKPDPTKAVDLALAHIDVFPDLGGMPKGATMKNITCWGATPDPAKYMPAVVDQMLKNGYSEQDCHKILGGNFMRVFEQVWRA